MATVFELKDKLESEIRAAVGDQSAPVVLNDPPANIDADWAVPCFPFAKKLGAAPPEIAKDLAEKLTGAELIGKAQAAGPYLNLSLNPAKFGQDAIAQVTKEKEKYGTWADKNQSVMIEFSSPNTNKPLHLGHVRNQTLGWLLSQVYQAAGYKVIKGVLFNDRGIHICKSMVAYQNWGEGATPESRGVKGDHLVGDFYVLFEQKFSAEYEKWANEQGFDSQNPPAGKTKEEFFNLPDSRLGEQTRECLQKWENNDKATRELWKKMNSWVLAGMQDTYAKFRIKFDVSDYESKTCLLGKDIVAEGVKKGVFHKNEDGSVVVDLEKWKLGEKVLVRANGTTLYITQDLGTAKRRHDEYDLSQLIYVVASEQNYHFQVLLKILELLGYDWAKGFSHFSYGMVNLPEGKMKSREGTVVDADDFLEDMEKMVLSKIKNSEADLKDEDKPALAYEIALGAINFYILWHSPHKNMIFDPKKSLSLEGDTGPYIQYAATRIKGILRKAGETDVKPNFELLKEPEERKLIKIIFEYPFVIEKSADTKNTLLIPAYTLGLSKAVTAFYQKHNVKDAQPALKATRVALLQAVLQVLENALNLMNIKVVDKM